MGSGSGDEETDGHDDDEVGVARAPPTTKAGPDKSRNGGVT